MVIYARVVQLLRHVPHSLTYTPTQPFQSAVSALCLSTDRA